MRNSTELKSIVFLKPLQISDSCRNSSSSGHLIHTSDHHGFWWKKNSPLTKDSLEFVTFLDPSGTWCRHPSLNDLATKSSFRHKYYSMADHTSMLRQSCTWFESLNFQWILCFGEKCIVFLWWFFWNTLGVNGQRDRNVGLIRDVRFVPKMRNSASN
jgi:hypothetical protein